MTFNLLTFTEKETYDYTVSHERELSVTIIFGTLIAQSIVVSICPSQLLNATVLPWETVKPENQALAYFFL